MKGNRAKRIGAEDHKHVENSIYRVTEVYTVLDVIGFYGQTLAKTEVYTAWQFALQKLCQVTYKLVFYKKHFRSRSCLASGFHN